MTRTIERWCVYAGPLFLILFGVGFWVVGGLVPPPSPNIPAPELAAFYAENATRIRIGLMISMLAAGLTSLFTVAIFMQMKRIEGGVRPLGCLQLATGLLNTPLFIFPMMALAAATFRAGSTDPSTTQSLSDLGWMAFVGIPAPAIVQLISIALASFHDRGEHPIFPRWLGYFNLWCALSFVFGILVIAFKTGPFAWDGALAFWVPLTIFSIWFFVMAWVMLQRLRQQELAGDEDLAATDSNPA